MSNPRIKLFYNNYPDDWKIICERIYKERGKKCEDCGSDKKLTVSHNDQLTYNNEDSNLTIRCSSCHIKYDQPFHVFSMGTNKKQTDNSNLQVKVDLRLESLKLIDKKEINVLEAFAGDGKIWKEVMKQTDKIINILRIDKKNGKKGVYLKGDNTKFIQLFDFKHYDIIDLDAYGSPYNQLKAVFAGNYSGVVHCTFIQVGMGALNHGLLNDIGFTKDMIKKAPTLFNSNALGKMKEYLLVNGVKEINICSISDRKHYFYFHK